MTCRQAQSLLDAYLDSELSVDDNRLFLSHLNNCQECQRELDSSRQLREILSNKPVTNPRNEYWEEVTSLILARTVGNESPGGGGSVFSSNANSDKSHLMQSILAVVASLVLLFSALYVGINKSAGPIAASPAVSEGTLETQVWLVDTDKFLVFTAEDEAMLTRGILYLAPPGPLSRLDAVAGLRTARKTKETK